MVGVKKRMVCGLRLTSVSILAPPQKSWVISDKSVYAYQPQLLLLQKGIQIFYCSSVVTITRDSVWEKYVSQNQAQSKHFIQIHIPGVCFQMMKGRLFRQQNNPGWKRKVCQPLGSVSLPSLLQNSGLSPLFSSSKSAPKRECDISHWPLLVHELTSSPPLPGRLHIPSLLCNNRKNGFVSG